MISLKIEQGLEKSRTLVLFMSENAFASEWVTLERHIAQFRDPTNAKRSFIPLRLDDVDIKDTLKQFAYVDWRDKSKEEYAKLLTGIAKDDANIIQRDSEAEDENGYNLISPKKPTKSDLLEDKFTNEMDKLVAPLNAKIGNSDIFLKGAPGYKDSRFARHKEYFSFWDKINENKYRCPDYLHSAIDNYIMNKTDKVGERTRDLSYEKAESELFEAIRKRYTELRNIINTEYHASAENISIAQDKPLLKFILTEWYKDIKNISCKDINGIQYPQKEITLMPMFYEPTQDN